MSKQIIASELRSAIEYYTELTVNEHLSQRINPDADEAWKTITNLIEQLAEEV